MAQVKWIIAKTQAAYDGVQDKASTNLYFVEETGKIYKGSQEFSETYKLVSSFPDSGISGIIYFDSATLEGKIWVGTEWKTVISPLSTTLDENTPDVNLVSAKAVKDYVVSSIAKEIANVQASTITDVQYDEASKSIKVTKQGTTVDSPLKGFITGIKYNADDAVLTANILGGDDINIQMDKENFLQDVDYVQVADENDDTEAPYIKFTMVSGSVIKIPHKDFIDVYTASSTDSVTLAIDSNNITANVNVDTVTANNALSITQNGLYVNTSAKMDKVAEDTTGQILVSNAGNASATGYTTGTGTLGNSTTTLATEAAVAAVVTTLQDGIATKLNASAVITSVPANAAGASDTEVMSAKAVMTAISAVDTAAVQKTDISTSIPADGASATKVASEAAVSEAVSWTILE